MASGIVSVEGEEVLLPDPFIVIATQTPQVMEIPLLCAFRKTTGFVCHFLLTATQVAPLGKVFDELAAQFAEFRQRGSADGDGVEMGLRRHEILHVEPCRGGRRRR